MVDIVSFRQRMKINDIYVYNISLNHDKQMISSVNTPEKV
jgi:hypothetical protein